MFSFLTPKKPTLSEVTFIFRLQMPLASSLQVCNHSFIAVELMFELKEKLGINVSEKEFSNIGTVRDIVNFIRKNRAKERKGRKWKDH